LANALDAWIADELRRAGFGENEVWPRRVEPRVVEPGLAEFERHLVAVEDDIIDKETRRDDVMMKSVRSRIFALRNKLPGSASAHALGRFYRKQIDVMAADIEQGPILMVSTKTMTTDYMKNIANRFEEAIGDGTNLKARFPLASLGYVMLTPAAVFDEPNAYRKLDNLVRSLTTDAGLHDAATLVVFDSDETGNWVLDGSDERIPGDGWSFGPFFQSLLEHIFETTPIDYFPEQRRRWGYTEPGVRLAPPAL